MSNNDRIAGFRRRHWLLAAPASLIVMSVAAHRWWSTRSPASGLGGTSIFASLDAGRTIDRWTVVAVHPIHLGAVPVILATAEGRRYQVDVMVRDPEGPSGVANTSHLSLFVVNSHVTGDDGQRPTDEEQGLGAIVLAQALATETTVPGLLTLNERLQQHPRGAFGVPLA